MDEFTRKEWKQSAKKWKVNPQQHRRGNLLLTRNLSLWSGGASEPVKSYRVEEGEQAHRSQLRKAERLLIKLRVKDGWIGSEQSEGKPVHQMGMVAW